MAKKGGRSEFVCNACGHSAARWLGRCPGCQEWGSLVEQRVQPTGATAPSARAGARGERPRPVKIGEVPSESSSRLATGIGELDRTLGGGLVSGGVVLVGGDPGIGKSTLMLQALAGFARQGANCLYVTGEESAAQVAMRAERLADPALRDISILATTELEDVLDALQAELPKVLVVDSVQTLRSTALESAAGSVAQLREVTARLIDVAKGRSVGLFLIGHVTKEGALAGPKVLEHLVDTVVSFEGDSTQTYRIVRTSKNRFGPAHELGVFEMQEGGLVEVSDPSTLFLAQRPVHAPGSLVVPVAQGQRPLLVEVQALVAPAAYGAARRLATGVDAGRTAILLAVLDRKAQINVLDQDVFVSAVGGARVDEPAADLALACAIVSSLRDRAAEPRTVVFGELGLTGEVRAVPRPAARLAEARKLGFTRAVLPLACMERLGTSEREGIELSPVTRVEQALEAVLP